MQLKNDGVNVLAHGYTSDVRNRLATVGNGVHTAHYTRQPGTGLLTQTQIKDASNNVVMTADRTYDQHHRLTGVTSAAGTTTRGYVYEYDDKDRRVSKKVYAKTAEATEWMLAKHEKFAYDGWNMIAVFNAEDALQKSYLWGKDLSGSMQGAGGVGGLLAETSASGSYFPMYNGNGDVMAYVNIGGAIAAEYLYDTFGRIILKTGDLADTFDFRFSTKYLD